MFWDNVAGVYDVFVNILNRKTHKALRAIVADLIEPEDEVLECACGTGLLSTVIAGRCKTLTATDYSGKMLQKAKKNCAGYKNVNFSRENIMALPYPDNSFDKVIAGNVIHLLDEPLKALSELDRVCKSGGILIIPTYMNKERKDQSYGFVSAVGKAGADFKRQFTEESYQQFFRVAGYQDVTITLADGKIPCAVAVMGKAAPKRGCPAI